MLRHGGEHRIVVLTAMQTGIFAAKFLRICSAANKDPVFQARATIAAPPNSDKLLHVHAVPAAEAITI